MVNQKIDQLPINPKIPVNPNMKANSAASPDEPAAFNLAATKFWGVWLPVPTIIAILNSIFWTWLILKTVGYTENPIERAARNIIERF
jgi:hypothetical protein